MPHSSSFIAQDEMKRSIVESTNEDNSDFTLDPKAIWGLYCMYAIVGLVYGFIQNNITLPICFYVFGPLDVDSSAWAPGRAQLSQCNIASAIPTMPWNLKVFYGLFLDQFGFFGTRRKGWIIFGWTGALILLVVVGSMAEGLANQAPIVATHTSAGKTVNVPMWPYVPINQTINWETGEPDGGKVFDETGYKTTEDWVGTDGKVQHAKDDVINTESDFFTYEMIPLVQCFFYIFSDVAGDGMTIELSRFEPPEKRGYILTTGQMTRFASTILANILGILFMNGVDYTAAKDAANAFPFEIPFGWVHFVLVIMCIPFYAGMVFFLQDPPKDENHEHHSLMQIGEKLWVLMKTKVMFFLIIGMLGNMAIASLINPAQNVIQSIVSPSTLQNGVGSLFGNLIFLVGVSIFRKYLMDKNWRYTFVATGVIMALNGCFAFIMIYNVGGFGQTGWFFVFGNNVLSIIQGVSQVLSSLAVVEVAPKGFEASVYEFLTTMHNAGITLNLNLMGLLQPIFGVTSIIKNGYACTKPCCHETACTPADACTSFGIVDVQAVSCKRELNYFEDNCVQNTAWNDACNHDNGLLATATGFTMVVNVAGVIGVAFLIPANKKDCKDWLEAPGCWQSVAIGALGSVIGWGCLFFSLTVSFLSIIPATTCLAIAGGDGC